MQRCWIPVQYLSASMQGFLLHLAQQTLAHIFSQNPAGEERERVLVHLLYSWKTALMDNDLPQPPPLSVSFPALYPYSPLGCLG